MPKIQHQEDCFIAIENRCIILKAIKSVIQEFDNLRLIVCKRQGKVEEMVKMFKS